MQLCCVLGEVEISDEGLCQLTAMCLLSAAVYPSHSSSNFRSDYVSKKLPVEAKRNMLRDFRPCDLAKRLSVEDEQERIAPVGVENHREDHSLVFVLCLGLATNTGSPG